MLMNNKISLKKFLVITFLILAVLSFVPSIILYSNKPNKTVDKKDFTIEKLPYQTKTYYEAYNDKIDLSINPINLDANKNKIMLFNTSPHFFVLVVDKRMAFVSINAFIKTLEYPIQNIPCTDFLWFICKLTDIGKVMNYNVEITKNERSLVCDGEKMSIDNFKLILKNMINCQLKNKTDDDKN